MKKNILLELYRNSKAHLNLTYFVLDSHDSNKAYNGLTEYKAFSFYSNNFYCFDFNTKPLLNRKFYFEQISHQRNS